MALDVFDHPLYAQRKYFVQEIAGLDDVFDFLDEWPEEKRNLAYETMVDVCRRAAKGEFSAEVVRENFRRFLKQQGQLASVGDAQPFLTRRSDRNLGGV
jgi:circadian clock protein KaiC